MVRLALMFVLYCYMQVLLELQHCLAGTVYQTANTWLLTAHGDGRPMRNRQRHVLAHNNRSAAALPFDSNALADWPRKASCMSSL